MEVRNKRLQKELSIIFKSELQGVSVVPHDDNLGEWTVRVDGPKNTPYEGGIFEIVCTFPNNYPFDPPTIKVVTPIIHPNINEKGDICLGISQGSWSASTTMHRTLLSIVSVLSIPNPDDPLVPEIANMYKTHYEEYVKIATKCTLKYAIDRNRS